MTRIEDDLRQFYLDRAAGAPDEAVLLAWLDETTADGVETLPADRPRATQPKPRRLGIALSVIGLVIAVVLASLWLGGEFNSTRQRTPTGTTSDPSQPKSQGIQGAFIDPKHPDVVQVVASVAFAVTGHTCQYRRSVTVVRQDSRSVTVLVAPPKPKIGTATVEPEPELMHCATSTGLLPKIVSLRLHAPLGTRTVIDQLSGRSIQVFDLSALPQPNVPPPGYLAQPVQLMVPSITDTGVVGTGYTQVAGHSPLDENSVSAERTYRHGADVLEITEGPPDPSFDPVKVDAANRKPMSVDGHRAYLATTPIRSNPVCITWKASASRAVVVCSANDPLNASRPGPAPLTTAQVLAIARNMTTSQ